MKHYLLIIPFILLCSTGYAETPFNELFDTELGNFTELADRVASYHSENIDLPVNTRINELEALAINIDNILKIKSDNPVIWFIKGLNHSNLAAAYSSDNIDKKDFHIHEKDVAYKKAMDLDMGHSPHLTPSIYASIKHGMPERERIHAIQQELLLGGNGDNDSYYWQLHWSNISALEQAGQFDAAQKALENMKRELKEQHLTNTDYDKIVERAQHDIDQTRSLKNSEQKEKLAAETKIADERIDGPISEVGIPLWAIFIISTLSLLALAIYEFKIRRKKQP
ncbi:MAG: hypothetical protein OEY43_01285 [Gammaproteobacteria bacterium]|nr:hypothetical protein [Gammaproteobacteria bacterium]